jgi:hypothetical protein
MFPSVKKHSKQSKYLQRQLSSFSETITSFSESVKSILPSKSFSKLSSSPHHSDSHLDLSSLYDLCMILKDMILQLGARAIIHDFLLMLYVECTEKSPDPNYVINWIKSRFWLRILEQDAELLIEYMKLFHPLTTENLSEYDGFLNMLDQDPLLLYVATNPSPTNTNISLPSKEKWCEKMSNFVKERAGQLFWDRAKLNHERKLISRKFRSFTRLVSGNFQSNKVTPVPTSEMVDQSLTPDVEGEHQGESESEIGKLNRKFIRQKSMFEQNASWMERARADSDPHSCSIKGQRSLQSVDFMKLHHPHAALTLNGLGETKSEHQYEPDKTSSFHVSQTTPIRLPSSQFKEEGDVKSSLLLEDA